MSKPFVRKSTGSATVSVFRAGRQIDVEIAGRLWDGSFAEIEEVVIAALGNLEFGAVLFDLTGAENRCSMLLRMIVRIRRMRPPDDARLVILVTPGSLVEEQLRLSNFDRMVPMAGTRADAQAVLQQSND